MGLGRLGLVCVWPIHSWALYISACAHACARKDTCATVNAHAMLSIVGRA